MKDKISILNYEIYLMDYAEGTLSFDEMKEVEAFLSQNPAIKDEFESMLTFKLSPDSIKSDHSFEFKEQIKKKEESILPKRFMNFNEFLTARIEEELNDEELRIFNLTIENNPDKKKDFRIMQLSFLEANTSVRFNEKSTLHAEIIHAMPEKFRNFQEFAIAAIEGGLTKNEQESLQRIIAHDKTKAQEYARLNACKLIPDINVSYPNKSSLKKKAPVVVFRRKILLPLTSVAAAAAILIFMLINIPTDINQPELATFYELKQTKNDVTFPETAKNMEITTASANPTQFKPRKTIPTISPNKTKNEKIEIDNQINTEIIKYPDEIEKHVSIKNNVETSSENISSNNYIVERINSETVNNPSPVNNSYKMDQYFMLQFRKKVLEENPDEYNNRKFSAWDLADAGLRRTGKIIGREWQLKKEYDDDGKIKQVAFNSQMISFDAPVNQRNK